MNVVGVDIGFGFYQGKQRQGYAGIQVDFWRGHRHTVPRAPVELASNPEEHLHVELEGESFYVGELAERQSHVRSFTLDQNQFITNFAKIMAMAALSRLVSANDTDHTS